MGRVFALATLATGGLIIADLWAHPKVTGNVLGTIRTISGYVAGR